MAESSKSKDEEIKCPFCLEGKILVTIIPEHYSTHAARAFGRVKRIPVHHSEKVIVNNKCPNCGKSKNEIKEVIERGKTKVLSHKERIAMLKKRGLPLVIGGK